MFVNSINFEHMEFVGIKASYAAAASSYVKINILLENIIYNRLYGTCGRITLHLIKILILFSNFYFFRVVR